VTRHLRLIEGDGPELPPLRVAMTHRSIHSVTAMIVEAAQDWTAYMVGSGALDEFTTESEYGRLTIRLTDAVTEYEMRMTGIELPPETQNGPITLW
jgi:hypothetical protein